MTHNDPRNPPVRFIDQSPIEYTHSKSKSKAYGKAHKQLRARLIAQLPTPCVRCGRIIPAGIDTKLIHLDHYDIAARNGGLAGQGALAHRRCNEQDGAAHTNSRRRRSNQSEINSQELPNAIAPAPGSFGGASGNPALSSALKGEMDPIEAYGITLNQAAIDAEMAAQGTDTLTGSQEAAAKQQAILSLIAKQGTDSQGQYAAQMDTVAQQQQRANAEFENAKAALGEALLPVVASVADLFADMAKFVSENTTVFYALAAVVAVVAAAILILNVAYKINAIATGIQARATDTATRAQWKLNFAFLASPITWIIIGIVALIAAIVLIATKTTWFQDLWETVWGAIKGAAEAVWEWLEGAATATIDFVAGLWTNISNAAQAVWDWIVNLVKTVMKTIQTVVRTYINVIVTIWNTLKAAVKAVWDWIKNAVRTVLEGIRAYIRFYINIYVTIWNTIKSAVKAVWDWIARAIDTVLDRIKSYVQTAMDKVVSIFEGIKSAVGSVWDWLKDAASTALNAILDPVNAIKSAFDRVVDAIQDMIHWLGNIQMPAALENVGDAIGNITPWGAVSPASVSAGTFASVAPSTRVPSLTASTKRASSRSNNAPQIVINGALDPVAVARQIRLILRADERRRSGVRIA